MGPETASTPLDIERYFRVLLRQWRLIVAVTVAGVVASFGFLALAPRQYSATTTVNLTVISTEPFAARSAPSSLLDEQEERAIAQSHAVAERAAASMGGGMTASEIRAASTVSTSSGAAVVSVGFMAGTPQQASSGADAVASAYLSYRRDRAEERVAVLVGGLSDRIEDLEGQVAEIDDELSAFEPGDPAVARRSTERQQTLNELDGLLAERNGLQSVDTTPGHVLSAAADNAIEVAPSSRLTVLTGLAAGVVLGVLAAFLRNPRDRRLRSADEVARALDAPILSSLGPSGTQIPPRGEDAAALRMARERMLGRVEPGETIVVMDAGGGPHISSLALNLVVLTAQSGRRVRLFTPEEPQHVRVRLSGIFQPGENQAEIAGGDGALQLIGASGDGGDEHEDLIISRQVTAAADGAGPHTLNFLVVSTQAAPASLLAALRVSQAMVLVAQEMTTTSTEVDWLRREAAATGAVILGAVVEKRRQRRNGDGRRTTSHARRRNSTRNGEPAQRPEVVRDGASVPAAS